MDHRIMFKVYYPLTMGRKVVEKLGCKKVNKPNLTYPYNDNFRH